MHRKGKEKRTGGEGRGERDVDGVDAFM